MEGFLLFYQLGKVVTMRWVFSSRHNFIKPNRFTQTVFYKYMTYQILNLDTFCHGLCVYLWVIPLLATILFRKPTENSIILGSISFHRLKRYSL